MPDADRALAQARPGLVPQPHHCRGFGIVLGFSTRHRTVHFRSSSRTTPDALDGAPFASTLTTTAFDRSSSRWFEACPCSADFEGPALIFSKAPLLLDNIPPSLRSGARS
jgi:hypothetical protein